MGRKKAFRNDNSIWPLSGFGNSLRSLFRRKNPLGFTLIEILIAIGVLGVLVTSVMVIFNPKNQVKKAYDARRKSDLKEVQTALEVYMNENGRYPASTADYQISGGNWGSSWGTYMSKVPQDPVAGKSYIYTTDATGQTYYLYASMDDETHTLSNFPSGASCGTACNYGISSPGEVAMAPNTPTPLPPPTSTPGPTSTPVPLPTSTPTPVPTLTPTPTPSINNVVVFYMSTVTTQGNLGGRAGADTFCVNNRPNGLNSATASNTHAVLSVNSADEVRDMPSVYGYNSSKPLYWWNNGSPVKFANNWTDFLDGTISVSPQSGGITQAYFTGSNQDGSMLSNWNCLSWTSKTSWGTYGCGGDVTSVGDITSTSCGYFLRASSINPGAGCKSPAPYCSNPDYCENAYCSYFERVLCATIYKP